VPIGVPGELHIGGNGLAGGYLDQPELTAERFQSDPYGPAGTRLYRTGDRVVLRPDGNLAFLGRLDDQVKVRGHRIELGEIEATLVRHHAVAEAAVVVETEGESSCLVAYLVPAGATLDPAELRSHLTATLPAYMAPERYLTVAAMPLTPNGKVDRRALPAVATALSTGDRNGPAVDTTTLLYQEVARIWASALGVADVGPYDDLFELGGHSLTITQIAARIRRVLWIDLPLQLFYDEPTVAGIVRALETEDDADAAETSR
jgi:acyl carrier protein